ncbi:acetyltransferase-like isoleucine patch superfamily enzyme [Dysgonomonadaceae bacterium PH5-43]|nr:acetyltransferase-like isoleucine patch superfamily enzyme [Dysgonomonadaceae bacterium PH5-43]
MKSILNNIAKFIIHRAYPQFKRRKEYASYGLILKRYFFLQKIIGFNRSVPWPVHFTSVVRGWESIEKGICCDPGDNPGLYINASGGLKLGNNVAIGANTSITTVNHYKYDHRKQGYKKGITIGDNVWIGANCSITAGVTIGDNVVIGAGCTVRENIPSNVVVIGSASNLEIIPKKKDYEWDCTKEELM